jgi:6-phosphogluconate dehydrogenase
MQHFLLIMGVSGSGKTTIGKSLSQSLGLPYIEADDAHPPENVTKMKSGQPLNDDDRWPWLNNLATKMKASASTGFVVSCSALKQKYRDFLQTRFDSTLQIVFLDGSFELIKKRMDARENHFMPTALLQNQFDNLERPTDAIIADIQQDLTEITADIINQLNMKNDQPTVDLGLIGLGVMGKSLARNFASRGLRVGVYNVPFPGEETVVEDFTNQFSDLNFLSATSIENLVSQLKTPRIILLMVKSGDPVDELIEKLRPHLTNSDLIIDAGNSYFKDSIRRSEYCDQQGLEFVGMGVSGGEKGALEGPSIMPAGSDVAKKRLLPILQKIAAVADEKPCVNWVGQDGAGHFVKMIHNGIEYADMQILSEAYAVGKQFLTKNNPDLADIFAEWNDSLHQSYLLEITIQILRKKQDGNSLLEQILDVAGHKGTGLWTTKEALDLGVPAPTITSAMNERILSSKKVLREKLTDGKNEPMSTANSLDKVVFKNAILFARLIALAEGFYLIRQAAKKYNWTFKMADLAQIWRGGCIIRSEMLKVVIDAFDHQPDAEHLFAIPIFREKIEELLPNAKAIVGQISETDIAIPAISAALNYYKSLHTNYLAINLIQAQRDFFGAHTYRRLDNREEAVHTEWE